MSYKQNQFGEANLQLSFHEGDALEIDGVNCMKVEMDIDYFQDPVAHALLEVIPNHFRGPTDPITAYVLRWPAVTRSYRPLSRRTRSKRRRCEGWTLSSDL